MDLYVLGCPEHDLTNSGKCLSVCPSGCVSVHMWQKFCSKCRSKINAQNLMTLYILNYTTINWCLSTFEENRSTGGTVITLFLEFLGHAYLDFYSVFRSLFKSKFRLNLANVLYIYTLCSQTEVSWFCPRPIPRSCTCLCTTGEVSAPPVKKVRSSQHNFPATNHPS